MMTRRRFQDPKPFREGNWWWIKARQDEISNGRYERKQKRVKVCPAQMPEREALKIAAEILRPMNQGLQTVGSATRFADYVNGTYKPVVLPMLASTTRITFEGTLRKYLLPVFADTPLRDMSTLSLQQYFSRLGASSLSGYTVLKIKEVLSSVLGSALLYELLTRNPMLAVKVPRNKVVNRKKTKPYVTPEEFHDLLAVVAEPYATMIYVAALSGLRVSELVGLRWEDVHADSLTIDERCCRGDWSITKTDGSATTIGVSPSLIERIQRLRSLEVDVNWGGNGARRRFKLVRSEQPHDLVFQSIRTGGVMNDQNILRRHLRPAALNRGIDPKKVTWRSLRRSCATWMVQADVDPKSVQAQMRHSRISTTMDIYAQVVPESQRRAVAKTAEMVARRFAELDAKNVLVQ